MLPKTDFFKESESIFVQTLFLWVCMLYVIINDLYLVKMLFKPHVFRLSESRILGLIIVCATMSIHCHRNSRILLIEQGSCYCSLSNCFVIKFVNLLALIISCVINSPLSNRPKVVHIIGAFWAASLVEILVI